ncbi:MAG: CsbD family protein [Cypionkella sp.]
MNKDQIEGRIEAAKGKIKEATGVLIDDKKFETQGEIQKNVGKIQAGLGDLKEEIKDEIKKEIKAEG